MIKISTSARQITPNQAPTNSPPFNPFHSNLTAALQTSGSSNAITQQLSPVSQVSDLAGRGRDRQQPFSALNTGFSELNGNPGPNLIDHLPECDDTTYTAPQYDPWNHLHAFSAPDPPLASWSGLPSSNFEKPYPGSPDAVGSLQGSWTLNHVQSLDAPYQSTSYGAVNDTYLVFDDLTSTPVEQRGLNPGYAPPFQNLDRSRASSFSKPTHTRSPHVYPLSSNLSVEDENAFQSPLDFLVEDFDNDERADPAMFDDYGQTYQVDSENILLNGLKSPVGQQHGPHSNEMIFSDAQGMLQWPLYNDSVSKSLDVDAEMFPELPEVDSYSFLPVALRPSPANTKSNPPSTESVFENPNPSSPLTKREYPSPHEHGSTLKRIPNDGIRRPRRTTLPTASTSIDHGERIVLPNRSPSMKAKVHGIGKRPRRNSLNENRKPPPSTQIVPSARKGQRTGGLERSKAEQIKKKRQARLTCIRCRSKRITCTCSPEHPECEPCVKQGCRCTRADFAEMTSAQTCNFIFQTSLSHITLDGLRRITIPYPAMIDADWLLNQLALQHKRFNIQINSITGAIWSINLGRCYELLSKLPWQHGARRLELDDLVQNRRMPLASWLECMTPGKGDGEFEQLLKYTNMPNMNAYALLFLNGHERSRVLDVQHSGDRDLILMSAQLCRIILRALELKGFRNLQKELGDISRLQNIAMKKAVVDRTGRLLGTMRWRLASWKLNGNGPAGLDLEFSARVKKITLSLYFWFLFVKDQLPEDIQSAFPKGTSTYYAETEQTWDKFPEIGSLEGFESWLLDAHSLIANSLATATPTFVHPEQFIQQSDLTEDAASQEPPRPDWHLPAEPRKISYDDSETNITWEFAYTTQST